MLKLEDIKVNSLVRGIVTNSVVTIKHVQMFGTQALEVTFVDERERLFDIIRELVKWERRPYLGI